MKNYLIIMLGSNDECASQNIAKAKLMLQDVFNVLSGSDMAVTEPYGRLYKNMFYNQAVALETDLSDEQSVQVFKNIERIIGRTPESKMCGIIPIDIDLIVSNGKIIHKDYERYDFVKKCVNQLLIL